MTKPKSLATRRQLLGGALAVGAVGVLARQSPASAKKAKPEATTQPPSNPKADAPAAGGAAAPASHPSLVLPALPYPETALEPVISATTLAVHHGKHHKAYYEKTNALLIGSPLSGHPLDEVVRGAAADPKQRKLFNNAAQAWNHAFYWQSLKPKGGGAPPGDLGKRVARDFGSYDAFKAQFIQAAIDHFSNGWVWLVLDDQKLKIVDTHDADTPLVHSQKPLAVADVWEHAYYLDYKNLRKDYVTGVVDHLINWEFVGKNLG